VSELSDLRDEWVDLIQSGELKFSNLSDQSKETFKTLFTTERGLSFVQEQTDVLRQFWFSAASPSHPQVEAANALLPPDRKILPIQALNSGWYVNLDILTDESTWGPVFPFLRNRNIERLTYPDDFPTGV
jgi:hypothetical protein